MDFSYESGNMHIALLVFGLVGFSIEEIIYHKKVKEYRDSLIFLYWGLALLLVGVVKYLLIADELTIEYMQSVLSLRVPSNDFFLFYRHALMFAYILIFIWLFRMLIVTLKKAVKVKI